ncbi:unnamed protein product [Penicillium egyptiacum]|uniref:DUF6536 domain-containing protein n=1 Tax=Penicillium egyptiacum TaxID=1303716 RepID=A0A9W4P3L0_9EURO|nr:unnamed protein product [Penicillium egyptiacum]
MGSEDIWPRAKSLFAGQRYHGVSSTQTEKSSLKFSHRIEGQENMEENTEAQVIEHESSNPPKPHWINGVLLCAKASAVMLLLNLIFIAVAAGLSNRNPENGGFSSIQVMYQGSCALSKRWNIALHLIINVLSTGILGASNYCMQSLVAPSREEVDKYHAQGRWLDIGSSSVRNLFVIGRPRLSLWLVLLITGTPFHLLYNSMVFQSVAVNELRGLVGPGDLNSSNVASLKTPTLDRCFTIAPTYKGGDTEWSPYNDRESYYHSSDGFPEGKLNWHDFSSDIAAGNYERLDAQECNKLHSFNENRGAKLVVMLTNELSVSQGGTDAIFWTDGLSGFPDHEMMGFNFARKSLVVNLLESGRDHYYKNENFTYQACMDTLDQNTCSDALFLLDWATRQKEPPTLESANQYVQSYSSSVVTAISYDEICHEDDIAAPESHTYHVNGCLVLRTENRCQLLYSPPICIIIALATFVKVVAMFLSARIGRHRSPPLLTVGDAVASFMEKPDSTTEGMCWLTNADVRKGVWKVSQRTEDPAEEPLGGVSQRKPMVYKRLSRRKLWMQAPSLKRWITTLTLCFALIAVGVFLFEQALDSTGSRLLTLSVLRQLWTEGFSGAGPSTTLVDLGKRLPALSNVVIANIPQLLITVSYFFYNSVLTSMLATAEYSSYGTSSKPLRVTWPIKGSTQQSTYWLSMPYRYGVPLIVIYMVLHWLISQCVFYVRVNAYDWVGRQIQHNSISSMGHNRLAIFISILVGAFMVCLLIGVSFRRFKSEMPLAGACSAAISAACHPPKDEDLSHVARGPVMWGETVASSSWGDFGATEDDKGHCSFTSLEPVEPSLSKMYA